MVIIRRINRIYNWPKQYIIGLFKYFLKENVAVGYLLYFFVSVARETIIIKYSTSFTYNIYIQYHLHSIRVLWVFLGKKGQRQCS